MFENFKSYYQFGTALSLEVYFPIVFQSISLKFLANSFRTRYKIFLIEIFRFHISDLEKVFIMVIYSLNRRLSFILTHWNTIQ